MIKIGALNFSDCVNNAEHGREFYENILLSFDICDVKYKLVDCMKYDCDIVFISPFNWHNMSEIKGNPIKIYFSGESDKRIDFTNINKSKCDFSLGFFNDSDTNLYYPLWQRIKMLFPVKRITDKHDFCSFIIGKYEPHYDGSKKRMEVFNMLSNNYKKVYSYGRYMNNMGIELPWNKIDAQNMHKSIKFNLCFENNSSVENESYITEKIINAYSYGTIPIYWGGGENLTRYFNKESFINCNGKSNDEIFDIVKYYDTHDTEYEKMLMSSPLNDMNINYIEYSSKRLINFLKLNGILSNCYSMVNQSNQLKQIVNKSNTQSILQKNTKKTKLEQLKEDIKKGKVVRVNDGHGRVWKSV